MPKAGYGLVMMMLVMTMMVMIIMLFCTWLAPISAPHIQAACLPKVDKRGKYTMRARVAMPCTCAWQRHGRARGNAMGVRVVYPITVQFGAPMVSGNYCVTGLLRILHSTVLYLALKKLSFGWKVLRYTVYLPKGFVSTGDDGSQVPSRCYQQR